MTYSILIPLRNGDPDDPRGRIPWWAAAERDTARMLTADKIMLEITHAAWLDGCSEVVYWQPYGTATGLRVESDQVRRLSSRHRILIENKIEDCRATGMRAVLGTGFGWPNQPWSPFRWRLGTLSNDGKWRYPNVDSGPDRRAVLADLVAAKVIGFDSVWIDQLASVEGELGDQQGSRWATAIHNSVGVGVAGEAHWQEDWTRHNTDMVSLGREIDNRRTKPRAMKVTLPNGLKSPRDIAWINGHGTVNGMPDGAPVRTPADQVEAGRRYAALGFEVCYEVDSVQAMRGIVEARNAG